ncbi:monocarboxylate transporter 12 [Caerostris extrusa]|uniref:Monocarboxylate transporter 12 n=1 Tax=Caerostris extrusa TaxID=172846 RepID=A0AAV4VEB2_CAEEX|nr:monocarboxylate transporter 12 [Caerostris extrusa]
MAVRMFEEFVCRDDEGRSGGGGGGGRRGRGVEFPDHPSPKTALHPGPAGGGGGRGGGGLLDPGAPRRRVGVGDRVRLLHVQRGGGRHRLQLRHLPRALRQLLQVQQGEDGVGGVPADGGYLLAGPVVSALTNKFGCRPVTIAGSIISCIAFLLSIGAPSIDVLMVTYGILAGKFKHIYTNIIILDILLPWCQKTIPKALAISGTDKAKRILLAHGRVCKKGGNQFGLIYLPAIVSVDTTFPRKGPLPLAVCGSGMGAFVFAPRPDAALDTYSWQGAPAHHGRVLPQLLRLLAPSMRPWNPGGQDGTGAGFFLYSHNIFMEGLSNNLF